MEDQVKEALNDIRPALQADGGDVMFVGMDGNNVKVKLTGACGGCPMATLTLKNGIEAHLKKKIPGLGSVVSV